VHMFRRADNGQLGGRCGPKRSSISRMNPRGRSDIGLRQIKREVASHAHVASQLDFAAQQTSEFAADRQTQTCASVLAAGTSIGLLKSFKDDSLFFGRNADAGISNFKCQNARRPV